MNIKQALKQKNKLVGLIKEEYTKAHTYNVVEEGNTRPYSSTESLKKWFELTDELINLKTKIHKANAPMYNRIFELAELKNQVKLLRGLDCTNGKVNASRWDDKIVVKQSEINIIERDNMVKNLELKIEMIQDELDVWNHNTLID
jgi:hypothetical protein